jgi:hypothetical protein
MVDLTIVVDLDDQQSLKDFAARLDLLDECLAKSRKHRQSQRCPHGRSWVAMRAMECWQCGQMTRRTVGA